MPTNTLQAAIIQTDEILVRVIVNSIRVYNQSTLILLKIFPGEIWTSHSMWYSKYLTFKYPI